MKKKSLLLSAVFVVVVLCASPALALDPMGPPCAGLRDGQWSAGVEYSYSDQDLWRDFDYDGDFKGLKQKMNKVYARLGHGISDKTEGFLRVGFSNYDYARDGYYAPWTGDDSGTLALGVGAKTTFSNDPDIKWGGLAQVSWATYDGQRKNSNSSSSYQKGTFKTEVVEFQMAIGPTCKLTEGVSVYGGPFMHLVDGNHHHKHGGGSREYDIEERASLGGYIGAQIDIAENAVFNIEYQHTGDAEGVAGGFIWRF